MANSVTARFNDDCKVHVAMSDDTTVTKAVIIDAEGNETDIGGGGGGSDLTIANVTVTNNIDQRYVAEVVNIVSMGGFEGVVTQAEITASATTSVKAVTYKNSCYFEIPEFDGAMIVTGNATYEGDGAVIITGDCTITINQI